MCKGFNCLDCPAFKSENCYYYGKGFIDYYKKVQLEKMNKYSNRNPINLETPELTSDFVL